MRVNWVIHGIIPGNNPIVAVYCRITKMTCVLSLYGLILKANISI